MGAAYLYVVESMIFESDTVRIISVIILVAVGFACVTVFNKRRVEKKMEKALLWKSTASLLFVLTAMNTLWASSCAAVSNYRLIVCLGLIFGMMGDIALDLKYVCPDQEKMFTYAGFVSFLIGHLFFIGALVLHYGSDVDYLYIIIPMVLAFLAAGVVLMGEKIMKLNYGSYKAIIFFYSLILIFFTLLSGSISIMTGFRPNLIIMFTGSVFFLISDLILSRTYFGEGKDRAVDIISNHYTYYLAQYLIALSLYFVCI